MSSTHPTPRLHPPRSRPRRAALTMLGGLLAGLLTWPAAPGHAQTVRTVVLVRGQDTLPPVVTTPGDSGAVRELPGFLVLLEPAGREVARTPADSTGLTALLAPAPGRYRLGVERIGYETTTSRVFEVGLDRIVDATVDFPTDPIALDNVTPDPDACVALSTNPAAQTLWGEAHKALRAVSWSDGGRRLAYVSSAYDRAWNEEGRLVHEATRTGAGKPRFGGVDPLGRYVVESEDGSITYHAPTPEILLDPAFTSAYCFSLLQNPAVRPGQTGLAFAPSQARAGTDIRGTLWIDDASLELRAVEWVYTDVPGDNMGGEMELARVSPARWSVQRWSLRVPRFQLRHGQRRHEGLRELGGELASVTPLEPSAVAAAPPGRREEDPPPAVWAPVTEESLRITLARRVSFGIKGGVGRATVGGGDVDTQQRNAFHLGAFVALAPAPLLALQIEGTYARRGAEDASGRLDVDYLDIPLLVVLHTEHLGRLKVTPRVAVGPALSLRLGCRLHDAASATATDCSDNTQALGFGLTVGAGLHLHVGSQTVMLEAAYLYGLTNANRAASHVFDFKNRDLSLSVGLSFALAGGL